MLSPPPVIPPRIPPDAVRLKGCTPPSADSVLPFVKSVISAWVSTFSASAQIAALSLSTSTGELAADTLIGEIARAVNAITKAVKRAIAFLNDFFILFHTPLMLD